MKKYIYIIYTLFFISNGLQAQVLWSDDFDNYTLGDLGTINSLYAQSVISPNPPVIGQGGWFVTRTVSTQNNLAYGHEAKIESEPGRGNVLVLKDVPTSLPASNNIFVTKVIGNGKPEGGIESFWKDRDAGNNILKFEYDLNTGNLGTTPAPEQGVSSITLNKASNSGYNRPLTADLKQMVGTRYITFPSGTFIRHLGFVVDQATVGNNILGSLTDNTWFTIIMYIDYNTGYLYLEVPSMNKAIRSTNPVPIIPNAQGQVLEPIDHVLIRFTANSNLGNGNRSPYFVKYDNLKMSAVNTLPLSLKKLAAATFTVFPNPVTDIVTITNSDNIGVEQIEVFDINGKKVKSQNFNKENEVQLNLTHLATGTYFLHIQTNAGTAVEKVIKK